MKRTYKLAIFTLLLSIVFISIFLSNKEVKEIEKTRIKIETCQEKYKKYNFYSDFNHKIRNVYTEEDLLEVKEKYKDNKCWNRLWNIEKEGRTKKEVAILIKEIKSKLGPVKKDEKLLNCFRSNIYSSCLSKEVFKCSEKKEELRNKENDWGRYVYSVYFEKTKEGKAKEKAYWEKEEKAEKVYQDNKRLAHSLECREELGRD